MFCVATFHLYTSSIHALSSLQAQWTVRRTPPCTCPNLVHTHLTRLVSKVLSLCFPTQDVGPFIAQVICSQQCRVDPRPCSRACVTCGNARFLESWCGWSLCLAHMKRTFCLRPSRGRIDRACASIEIVHIDPTCRDRLLPSTTPLQQCQIDAILSSDFVCRRVILCQRSLTPSALVCFEKAPLFTRVSFFCLVLGCFLWLLVLLRDSFLLLSCWIWLVCWFVCLLILFFWGGTSLVRVPV